MVSKLASILGLVAVGSTAGCLALAGVDKNYELAPADSGTDTLCVDTTSDPHNCGACGHDCLDGTCSKGMCDPIPVAPSVAGGGDLVVSATNVYFTDQYNGKVLSAPLTVASPQLVAQAQGTPSGIALDESGTQLFWANMGGGQIQAFDLVGDGGVRTLVSGQPSPTDVAAASGRVYYTLNAPEGGVGSVGADGAGPSVFAPGQAESIAVVGATVYFTLSVQGSVMKSDGSSTQSIAQGQSEPQGIAADSAGVYWANHGQGDGRVMVLGPNDTEPQLFQKSMWRPVDVAIDATTVYWVDDDGLVLKASRGGGASERLTQGPSSASAIAIDAKFVYWMAGGSVWRVAK